MTQPIPTTLDEAVDQLVAGMTEDDKTRYRAEREDYPGIRFHFSSGMAMRNGWGLWHGETGISRWLRERRIVHGDDQSATIYHALWRRLHGLPIDEAWVAEQAAYYEAYWARHGLTWDMQPIPGFAHRPSRTLRVYRDGSIKEDPSV